MTTLSKPSPLAKAPGRDWVWAKLRVLGRRLLVVALISFVLLALVLLHLRSDLHHALAPLGPQLANSGMLQALLDREEPVSGEDRVLVINGQRLQVATEVIDAPIGEALETALADCPTREELGGPIVGD
ncbi:MAG: hypothetical protein OEY14_02505, partial [Myxococcales bacterium]|nr:hypothetical protein [Myxococcales bacterium]